MEMSVGEEAVKTAGSETNPTPSLPPPPCAEPERNSNMSMMTEAPLVTPMATALVTPDGADPAASCPVLSSLTEQNHTRPASGNARTNSEYFGQKNARGNENHHIYRRNSFTHPKQQQQQQQQQKVNKRRNTMNFGGFKHPASGGKRRRRSNSESEGSVLPSNFLLGGNIFDPLNLNSLLDEEVSRTINAETPKSSPLPNKGRDPVEILIPRDITDPLNLNSGIAGTGFFRSAGRRRHRNRHHGGGGGGGGGGGIAAMHIECSESRRNSEVKVNAASVPPSTAASCPAAPEEPKESSALPRVPGDSHSSKEAERTGSSREEVVASVLSTPHIRAQSTDDDSSSATKEQHSSNRRKRRRNSGKMEPPSHVASSSSAAPAGKPGGSGNHRAYSAAPAGKPGRGPGNHRASGGWSSKSAQSTFHTPTPRTGQRSRPGGRPPKEQKPQKVFQYGNYNQYYGYRNSGANEDSRVRALRREWFEGKHVLDLGCNSGHLTLYIAKALKPAHILGLDIDSNLIYMARKNIRHYLSELQMEKVRRPTTTQESKSTKKEEANGKETPAGSEENQDKQRLSSSTESGSTAENGNAVGPERGKTPVAVEDNSGGPTDGRGPPPETEGGIQSEERMEQQEEVCDKAPATCVAATAPSLPFPVSLQISRGPIAAPPLTEKPTARPGEFPSNVTFVKANYVLENDNLLLTQRPEYDVIMCMSVTKWIHLNWGDDGLKRLFRRVYRHLRPGGLFIMEPQPWDSYARRKRLTETTFRNYHSIRLKPEQFSVYLMSSEVGFSSYELIGTPECRLRGFQRPIYLFHKSPRCLED